MGFANTGGNQPGKVQQHRQSVGRYVMQAQQEVWATTEELPLFANDFFLITEDELGVASLVAKALQQRGAKTAIIKSEILRSPQRLSQVITNKNSSVKGIIHLAGLAALPMPDNLREWRDHTQIQSKSLFQLLQLSVNDLQQQGKVMAASLLGGYFGRDGGGAGLATGGSSTGLLKTLRMEWAGVEGKAIDFDASLAPDQIAGHLINELLLPGGRLEVGYPQGQRTIFQTVSAPLNTATSPQITPNSDWVVLVTGGAQGITAQILQKFLLPGMRLIVVGRSPEPAPESPLTAGIEELGELRQILLNQAKTSGKTVTPRQIEEQIKQLKRDRTINHNLAQFRQAGASVFYESADVKSEEFGKLIDTIYNRYGRLDAVIHGAGIIEDKLIVDKTLESLQRVFDTKVDSSFTLYHHLRPDSLKVIVLFSSVAGRCGNRGQSDYGAANEVINRLAWQMDREWTNTRVVAINWGPWDTAGMASDQVKRQFRERGIIPIPLDAGCQFFVEELRYGKKGDTEIIAGEGPWEASDVVTLPKTRLLN
jgi:NAD(P)-dependent dehydrogenase (short-subunit alcohol dehydrogenase family)